MEWTSRSTRAVYGSSIRTCIIRSNDNRNSIVKEDIGYARRLLLAGSFNAFRYAITHKENGDIAYHLDFSRANCHRYVSVKLARQLGEASFLGQQSELTAAFAGGPYG